MNFWFELLQSILQIAIAPTTAAFVLAAIGLNVHFGFTGLMNMGQAGFMLVGAYGFGVSVSYFGLGFWPAIAIAVGAAIIFVANAYIAHRESRLVRRDASIAPCEAAEPGT